MFKALHCILSGGKWECDKEVEMPLPEIAAVAGAREGGDDDLIALKERVDLVTRWDCEQGLDIRLRADSLWKSRGGRGCR